MKCSKCNEEVAFGKYHVSTPFIEEKALDFNYYLYFDEYNPDKKPIRLAKRGFYIEGYYCYKCNQGIFNKNDCTKL